MIWMFQLAVGLLMVGGVWTLWSRNRRADEREALTMRRVDAYIETIRRERSNAELLAMSDSELRDLLHSGARNLRLAGERRAWAVLGATAVALLTSMLVAGEDGLRGFAIAILIGGLVIYGLSEFLGRQMREPLERYGIEINRLRVE